MRFYSEEELEMLTGVLSRLSQELRLKMVNLYIVMNKLVPIEAREEDDRVDQLTAAFMQSYFRLYRIVSNLSDSVQLTTHGSLVTTIDDIVGLVHDLCAKSESLFEAEGVELSYQSDCSSALIRMDPQLIDRMVMNLLSNALKFTPKGGKVSVRIRSTYDHVRLTVSDTGCGISPERREHLFDRYLYPNTMDPPQYGLGLGLALCKRIAEGHGGSIVVESEEGKGSSFTVTLPRDQSGRLILHDPGVVYGGGFNWTMVELADGMSLDSFRYPFMD